MTPKQVVYVPLQVKLYFCDREGTNVHRVSVDGCGHEVLVQRGCENGIERDMTKWCVGIAVDVDNGEITERKRAEVKRMKG